MKTIYTITISCLLLGAIACGSGGDDDVRNQARQSLVVPESTVPSPSTPLPPATPPTSTAAASGVHHYTCPNNCEGSGGASQVNCPVCGTQYVHNAAYHNQSTASTTTTPQPTQPTPEPAQNAAGVWHYTCPAGCEGGGGSAVACGTCGATLAHNTAYHN